MNPFLGSIAMVAFNFAPKGWALCNGQLLPINQNQALFSLLGTTYGGNGTTTFALPDLRGRTSLSTGQGPGLQNYTLGQLAGTESITLNSGQIPTHIHIPQGINSPGTTPPAGGYWAGSSTNDAIYSTATPDSTMNAATVMSVGSGQPHENRRPILTINFIIAMVGIYPSRS